MYNTGTFMEFLIEKTKQLLFDLRGEVPEFKMWFDKEEQVFKAKFSYGRVAEGSDVEATMGAIANVVTAIQQDGL